MESAAIVSTRGVHERDGSPARVMLVEKRPLFRDGLRSRLSREGWLSICGEASEASQASWIAAALLPDVALIGIDSVEPTVLQLINGMFRQSRAPKIIVLLEAESDSDTKAKLMRSGASAVLSKQVEGDELVEAIDAVLDGKAYLSADTIEQLVRRRRSGGSNE